MNQESMMGMVLSAIPVGDYDKRLVILTKDKGRIAAFARGARRPNSSLLAVSQPFTFGTFYVYQGRDSYTVAGAEITNYFEEIRTNLEAVYYGLYFCEFADFMSRENMDSTDLLKLLYQSLRVLIKNTIPFPLIRYIFEFKIMAINGEALQVFSCVKCADKEPGVCLSIQAGGLVCKNCSKNYKDMIVLDEATVYALSFIFATPVEKLYTFLVNDEVLEKLRTISERYLSVYLGHTFHSLSFLENSY